MNGTSRDLGLSGAGKGDSPRNVSKKFYENLARVRGMGKAEGFQRRGNRLRKVYR